MALTFGIAIVKVRPLDRLWQAKRRAALLDGLGLRAEPSGSGAFNSDVDLSEDTQLCVLQRPGEELWCGFPVAHMILEMHNTSPKLPKIDALLITHEASVSTYMSQVVGAGKYGPGELTPTDKGRSWRRTFPQGAHPIPRSSAMDQAANAFAAELGVPKDLFERLHTGMRGKGFYGIAWHEAKQAWVMAKSLSAEPWEDPSELQELNPNTYGKRGKPFAPSKARTPAFMTQDDAIYEIHHRAIARTLDARLDTQAGLDLLHGHPCTRFDIHRTAV